MVRFVALPRSMWHPAEPNTHSECVQRFRCRLLDARARLCSLTLSLGCVVRDNEVAMEHKAIPHAVVNGARD